MKGKSQAREYGFNSNFLSAERTNENRRINDSPDSISTQGVVPERGEASNRSHERVPSTPGQVFGFVPNSQIGTEGGDNIGSKTVGEGVPGEHPYHQYLCRYTKDPSLGRSKVSTMKLHVMT